LLKILSIAFSNVAAAVWRETLSRGILLIQILLAALEKLLVHEAIKE
jgi:hypothetical protein